MKLAFCLFKYFPYGGLQRDFLRIATACVARGHEVHVYTMRWEGERPAGLHIHLFSARGLQNHTRCKNFIENIQIELELQIPAFDVIMGFNKMPGLDIYYAADVCYQARVRKQKTALYRLLPRYQQWVALERAVFARDNTTQILVISPHQQAEFQHYYQTESSRFHLLPPGIAKDRMAPANAADIRHHLRASYQLTADDVLLLTVGSGFKTKGLDRALLALAALPHALQQRCHFFVIGQDHPRRFLRLAKKLGVADRVQFLGGRPDVPHFLLAADLLLHPAYHENTGTVLLEAMVAGLPVLTVDVCGYAHYVAEAGAGVVLSSPFQQAEFNLTLEKMLLSPQRVSWQQHGLAFAQQADIYDLPEKTADFIEITGQKKREYVFNGVITLCHSGTYVPVLGASRHPGRDVPRSHKVMTPLNKYSQKNVIFYLHDKLKPFFSSTTPTSLFDQVMVLRGESLRAQKERLTQRIQLGGKNYIIKQHTGAGWKEIFKNIFQGRLPIVSAENEWRALTKLQAVGVAVPTVVGFGKRGYNPAQIQSFILMEELAPVVSLETVAAQFPTWLTTFKVKQQLIMEIARVTRIMHQQGINHRDFYICHFLLETNKPVAQLSADQIKLFLIDLHRAQMRHHTPERWRIKDLAGLYFSSKDVALTQRDLFRFMKQYRQQSLRDILRTEEFFWKKVKMRGEKLYGEHVQR